MTRSVLVAVSCLALMASAGLSATLPRPSPDFVIHLTPSGETSPARYKGKVVLLAFIQTTCPHCQHSTEILTELQKEYGPRGLQVLEAAFNESAATAVPGFIQKFHPTFPVGWTTHREALAYLNHSVMTPIYVPAMVFIDRSGMIRRQYIGGDPFFNDQEKSLRSAIEELLKQPTLSKR